MDDSFSRHRQKTCRSASDSIADIWGQCKVGSMMNTINKHVKALTDFGGREARAEFWPFVGLVVASFAIAMMVMESTLILIVDGELRMDQKFVWIGLLMILMIGVLAAAVVRRLHDRGSSGAWGLLPLPFLAFAFYAMHRAALADLTDEMDSAFETAFVSGALYNISLIILIVLLAGRSEVGENRFGPPLDVS
ncbi:MAG: DUF805 domain-containing protein [Blastomonas sp.]|nr:DUF805 domain-containing protein [Blastomonas sp.]